MISAGAGQNNQDARGAPNPFTGRLVAAASLAPHPNPDALSDARVTAARGGGVRPSRESPAPPSTPGSPVSFPSHSGPAGSRSNFAPVSAATLLAEPDAPIPWVWEPFLPEGGLALLVSFMKVGKSTLAYPLALAVAQGRPFLGYPTKQGGVLILAVEEHSRDVRRRLRQWGMRSEDPIYVHHDRLDNTPATFADLQDFIRAHGIVLVILDTLPRFWTVENENANVEVIRQVSPFLDLARDTNAAVLLLHHERKSGGEDGREIRGGGALLGLVDQAILLSKRQGRGSTQRILKAIGRYDETPRELVIELDGAEYRRLGTSEDMEAAAQQARVWGALTDAPQDVAEIAKKAVLSEKATRKALEACGARVIREGKGVKGDPYTYRRAPQPDSMHSPALREGCVGKESNAPIPDAQLQGFVPAQEGAPETNCGGQESLLSQPTPIGGKETNPGMNGPLPGGAATVREPTAGRRRPAPTRRRQGAAPSTRWDPLLHGVAFTEDV